MAEGRNGTGLSAREDEVARLYIDGSSYKEIARDLAISPATVRTHLNTIYRKLEVTSRIELLHRLESNEPATESEAPVATQRPPSKPVAERRQLTVMFVDLVGSTALAAELDAEDMHELLQAYRKAVRGELEATGGHAAGFPGDGVVACFGWPKAMEDAAERALHAAMRIQAAIDRLEGPGGQALRCRIGIATGTVVVDGSKGDAESLTGGTPNLAARLQTVAEPGGIVIAAGTRALVGDLFITEDLGPREIKGLPAPVPVHAVRGERNAASRFEARQAGTLAPMVGRDVELALLAERWQRAKEGEGQAALLTGEAGIGKSRIAAALVEQASVERHAIIRYQTSPQQGDSPFWPMRRQLLRAAGLERLADDAARLAQLEAFLGEAGIDDPATVDILAELLDLEPARPLPSMSAKRRRDLIVGALCDWLLGLAEKTAALVVFEDLHWLDPSSLELLTALLARSDARRMMLVLTSRPEGAPPLAGHAHLTRISLSRLGKAAARSVVERLAGPHGLDDELIATILERTDGVPLYLEEMTRAVMEAGHDVTTVPASLQDSLMSRLDRQDTAKETAQIAACIGREVDQELLGAVAGGDALTLASDLDRLVEAELLFRRGDGFIFKHALVQDTAYQSLLRGRRAALHGRIAEVLLGRFPARASAEPQTVAHHLEQAGRPEAAVDYYSRAADLANYAGANVEARAYLERGLALIEAMPEGAERDRREVAALTMLGRIVVAQDGHASDATRRVYSRALARCREAGLGLAEFPIVLGLAVQAAVGGNEHRALDLADRLGELAQGSNDVVLLVEADYARGITRSWRGEFPQALAHFEAGIERYDAAQHSRHLALYSQDPGVVCHARRAISLWWMGHPKAAADGLETAWKLAHRLGHSFSINYVLNWRAIDAVERGDLAVAAEAVETMLDHAREQGFGIWLTMGAVTQAELILKSQSAERAVAEAERVLARVRETGTGCVEAQSLGLLGEALRRRGRPAEGLTRSREALALIEQGGARWNEVTVLCRHAACERDLGRLAEAEATLTQALDVAHRQSAHLLALRAARELALLWADRGERERASALLTRCLSALPDAKAAPDVPAAEADIAALAG